MIQMPVANSHSLWFSYCSVNPHASFHFIPAPECFSLATFCMSLYFLSPLLEPMILFPSQPIHCSTALGKFSYSGKQWSMFDFTTRLCLFVLQALLNHSLYLIHKVLLLMSSTAHRLKSANHLCIFNFYLSDTIDFCGLLRIKHMLRNFSKLDPRLFLFLPQGHSSKAMNLIPQSLKRKTGFQLNHFIG